MRYLEDMNKKAVILFKPSGTIAIGGDLSKTQRKFYDGFLYYAKNALEKDINTRWFFTYLKNLKSLLDRDELGKDNKYLKNEIKKMKNINVEYNILKKDKTIEGITSLILELEIITDNNTGEVLIKYNLPNMVREALLKDNKEALFAQINLIVKKNLKHKYSLIIYDLIKDYENVEIPTINIEEFRKILGVENKYKNFQDLKKRVINPVINEINCNPDIDWTIEYKLIKRGPKYVAIKFTKKRKPSIKKLEQEKTKKLENGKIDIILGLIPEQYRKSVKNFLSSIINTYPIDYIEAQINYTNNKNPENYVAYLKAAIKEDYANFQELKEKEKEKKEKEKELNELRKKVKELEERKKTLTEEAEKEFESLTEEEKEKLIKENMEFINNRNIARITAIGKIINKKIKENFSEEEIKLLNLKDKI